MVPKRLDRVINGKYRYIRRYLVRFWYGWAAGKTMAGCGSSTPSVAVLLRSSVSENAAHWPRNGIRLPRFYGGKRHDMSSGIHNSRGQSSTGATATRETRRTKSKPAFKLVAGATVARPWLLA